MPTQESWVRSLGWEDTLEEGGHGNPLQYSRPENPMDRGAWQLQSMGSQRVGHNVMTKQQQHIPGITDLSLFLSIQQGRV